MSVILMYNYIIFFTSLLRLVPRHYCIDNNLQNLLIMQKKNPQGNHDKPRTADNVQSTSFVFHTRNPITQQVNILSSLFISTTYLYVVEAKSRSLKTFKEPFQAKPKTLQVKSRCYD